jgi:hypothetical protein
VLLHPRLVPRVVVPVQLRERFHLLFQQFRARCGVRGFAVCSAEFGFELRDAGFCRGLVGAGFLGGFAGFLEVLF